MNDFDPYTVLGVGPRVGNRAIKEAYRKRVKECHPDTAAGEDGLGEFLQLQSAYEILMDAEKRRAYDRRSRNTTVHDTPPPVDPEPLRPDPFGGRRRRRQSIQDMFFAQTDPLADVHPGVRENQAAVLRYEVILTPEEAAGGVAFSVTVPVVADCPACSRAGVWGDIFCPACRGNRRIHTEHRLRVAIPPYPPTGRWLRYTPTDTSLSGVRIEIRVVLSGR
jgi:DnaJ-class molecular chaperone